MPAKSEKQRRFFSLVRAVQEGKIPRRNVSKHLRDTADSISKDDAHDFAIKHAFEHGFMAKASAANIPPSDAADILKIAFSSPGLSAEMGSGSALGGGRRRNINAGGLPGGNLGQTDQSNYDVDPRQMAAQSNKWREGSSARQAGRTPGGALNAVYNPRNPASFERQQNSLEQNQRSRLAASQPPPGMKVAPNGAYYTPGKASSNFATSGFGYGYNNKHGLHAGTGATRTAGNPYNRNGMGNPANPPAIDLAAANRSAVDRIKSGPILRQPGGRQSGASTVANRAPVSPAPLANTQIPAANTNGLAGSRQMRMPRNNYVSGVLGIA